MTGAHSIRDWNPDCEPSDLPLRYPSIHLSSESMPSSVLNVHASLFCHVMKRVEVCDELPQVVLRIEPPRSFLILPP